MKTYGSDKKTAALALLEQQKPLWFVLGHDHPLTRAWTYIMHICLIYTALNVPLNVAFDQSENAIQVQIDFVINIMFILDLFMNFIMGYEDEDRNSETRLKMIAKKYLSTWFFIDFLACIPAEIIILK